jgi:predicted Ser/Thr protein kinase
LEDEYMEGEDKKEIVEEKIAIQVQIGADDVNNYIAQAILKSRLGAKITEAINDYLKKMNEGYIWEQPIKKCLDAEIQAIVVEIVKEKFNARIKEIIEKEVTDEYLKKLLLDVISKIKISSY